MNVIELEKQYIRKLRPAAAKGDLLAWSNIAAAYRILEKFPLSARWYRKTAEAGFGDAMVDWGYCLQHAVGVKGDEPAAELMYRSAITSQSITDFGREEAMYHLAVLLLEKQKPYRREAKKLLLDASADGDYPEAETLLQSFNSSEPMTICICRRHLRPRLAKRHCPVHGPREVRYHPSIVI